MSDNALNVQKGQPYPLGATVTPQGINFSVFSSNATSVQLLLFDRYDQAQASHVISLDPEIHRTYYYWHAFLPGLGDGQIYAYRVLGPYQPERGLRFNPTKLLVDPYARAVAYGDNWDRRQAHGFYDNTASALKSVAVDNDTYDWEGDQPLQRPMDQTIIYEMHVRSLTAHRSSQVSCPGTFRGVTEKIDYLKDLGVTAIELLPVQQFDEQEVSRVSPITGEPLKNYWGYAPAAYFAPHLAYGYSGDARQAVDEFRDMVKALHRAGIEVILDVVFNHTAESGVAGPWISFRGLENITYYLLQGDPRFYHNYTGTGNTVNCNHSIVRRLIRQCLRYWVQEMHVDGFRFDLASVLSRNENGEPINDSPILWEIESDPVLASSKLIAEAWDAAGLYQLGAFTGDRWAEWNGRFRDDVRRFVRGDNDTVRDFAWRMAGSFDIFRDKPSYASHRSINYVTCHDGFTMYDLVSYHKKHNLANGEENRDGMDENYSWNMGVEGPSQDPKVQALRHRQIKNYIALLLLARGTPMLLGGDEMARSQQGNNNAYCQDNQISWYDWQDLARNSDIHRFVKTMIALRSCYESLTQSHPLGHRSWQDALTDGLSFHGVERDRPDWSYHSHSLAINFGGHDNEPDLYLIANAYKEALEFELPRNAWKRLIDTSLDTPDDIVTEDKAVDIDGTIYRVSARTVVLLIAAE